MQKALITGVTGMVGSHMCDFLLEKTNWNIYGICRWRSNPDNVSHLINDKLKKYLIKKRLNVIQPKFYKTGSQVIFNDNK